MITGCYDLRLACDVPGCKSGEYNQRRESEFAGEETGGRARARARRAGWWMDLKLGTCACPPCAEAGHRPTEMM